MKIQVKNKKNEEERDNGVKEVVADKNHQISSF